MKHFSYLRQIAAAVFSIMLFTCIMPCSAHAEEEYLPSLYICNDVWYKDRTAPVITENGNSFFVPSEAFAALPNVSLRTDESAKALLLTREERKFSCDTENGTVISPSGDKTITVLKANGTVYLPLHDVCSALGLGFELFAYSGGEVAVRINDGSDLFPFSYLVRMFVEQEEEATRTTYPYAEMLPFTKTVFIHTENELYSAISPPGNTNEKLLVIIDSQLIISQLGSNSAFTAHFARLLTNNAAIALAGSGNSSDMIKSVSAANSKIISIFHRGTYLFTYNSHLSTEDYAALTKVGLIHLSGIVDTSHRNNTEENTNAR